VRRFIKAHQIYQDAIAIVRPLRDDADRRGFLMDEHVNVTPSIIEPASGGGDRFVAPSAEMIRADTPDQKLMPRLRLAIQAQSDGKWLAGMSYGWLPDAPLKLERDADG
jgi:hypothetical protein